MTARVLTLNAGSSSVKFGLFTAEADPRCLARGEVEPIGGWARARLTEARGIHLADEPLAERAADHVAAVKAVLGLVGRHFPGAEVVAVGHRVVHGGVEHEGPALVTADVLAGIERLAPLAPLHQPHNIAGIRAARDAFPAALQVACFDTAFHRGQPFVSQTYALPRACYDRGIRRFGFHGLSYQYLAGELERIRPDLRGARVILAHLGNGASMCAVRGGVSEATTMGFTALDGLPMGTRSGQIDPGVLLYLMQEEGMDAAVLSDLLYRRSGLLGLSGLSGDMRVLEAAGTPEAEQAIAHFVHRVRREIGALAAVLGGVDALVFSGGIGENSARIRREVCAGMGWVGIDFDDDANTINAGTVSRVDSAMQVLVIPTDEEQVIARAAASFAV